MVRRVSRTVGVALAVTLLCSVRPGTAGAQTINEAAQQGNLARVRRLLRADQRLANYIGPDGNQPLHWAANEGRLEVVRLLIAAGADVNGVGHRPDHWTPLFNAASRGQAEIARMLLAYGARVDAKDNIGNTPLAFAADNHAEVAEILLAAGANVNDRREPLDGWTPMFTAVGHNALDAMRVLIRHGADLDIRSNNGNTAFHVAAQGGNDRSMALLISSGQSIDTLNADGNTPLMVAAWYGQMGSGRFLIGAGADLNIRNKAGRNALEEALQNHQAAFADMIRNYQLVLDARAAFDRAAKLAGIPIRSGYLNWSAPTVQAKRVYFNDFTSERVGPEWSTFPQQGEQQGALRVSATPKGGRRFLGELGSQTARLTLNDLPPHREISLYFDLYILRTWDGSNLNAGPDVWSLSLPDGPTLLRTTFCNTVGISNSNVRMQAYPGEYPTDHYPCQYGAVETNTLGYTGEIEGRQVPMDALYRLSYTLPHTGPTLKLDFSAVGLEPLDNESWGLTSVQVSVATPATPNAHPLVAHPHRSVAPVRHIARAVSHPAPAHHSSRQTAKHPGKSQPAARLHAKEKPPGL
jgi:ankyrin repeat protein